MCLECLLFSDLIFVVVCTVLAYQSALKVYCIYYYCYYYYHYYLSSLMKKIYR